MPRRLEPRRDVPATCKCCAPQPNYRFQRDEPPARPVNLVLRQLIPNNPRSGAKPILLLTTGDIS